MRYGLYPASFVHASGTLSLQQMYGSTFNPGSNHGLCRPGGGLNPAAHILGTANPSESHRTRDLLTLLNSGGISLISGLACSSGHTARLQKKLAGGAFSTGTAHYTRSSASGFAHIRSISDDIDSVEGAEAEVEYIPLSAAGLNPYTEDDDVDFTSAPAPAFMSQYHMGGVWLGSTQLTGLVRRTLTPGIIFAARRIDGGAWPVYGASSIVARAPMLSLTFLKADMTFNVLGSLFSAPLGSTLKNYYQRGTTAVDGRVAAGSASHIRVDVAAGNWGSDDVSVANEDDATLTIAVRVTGALAWSVGVAIP